MKNGRLFAWLLAVLMTFDAATAAVFAAASFPDVPEDAYYAEAVAWALEKEIANGNNGVFAPNDTVTRAQAVTFLWRMVGRPEPVQAEIFTDVENDPNNSWYKTADIDYENIPVAKEAELTLQILDTETWDPVETLAPVTVTFENWPD